MATFRIAGDGCMSYAEYTGGIRGYDESKTLVSVNDEEICRRPGISTTQLDAATDAII